MKKKITFKSAFYLFLILFIVLSLTAGLPGCAPEEPVPTPEPTPDPDVDDNDEDPAAELPNTKEVVMIIEGMEEVVELTLYQSQLGYYIYVDKNSYQVEKLNGADIITPLAPGDVPDVFMEISRTEDISPGDKASLLKEELEGEYEEVSEIDSLQSPVQGYYLYASQGDQWDDLLVRFYLMEDDKGNSLVIKQQLFMEAWEGHGARFDTMLEELGILN